MDEINIFVDPKELKKWAIKLANELGGQKVEKQTLLVPFRIDKVDKLIEKFVAHYNYNMKLMMRYDEALKQEEE
tara:strand:- start:960 stop:1181 length:222 start_codon:yes stop_codon:yes gene_type:complete